MRDLLRSVFLGNPQPWPDDVDPAKFLAYTQQQCVQPLLSRLLEASPSSALWPIEVRKQLALEAGREVVRDHHVLRELPRVLEAMDRSGVRALLTKGTPLSCTHYPEPGLRPRADTDLLIERSELPAVHRTLIGMGYVHPSTVEGEFISNQYSYAGPITLDVHWKVLNPPLLADVLTLSEMSEQAIAVPKLGPHARALGPVHSLLLACVHRAAHHGDDESDRLIWLYDIHLIVQRMDAAAFERFARLAAERRVRTLCLAGLEDSHHWFGTNLFAEISQRILQVPDAADELSARYLQRGLTRREKLKMDLRSLPLRSRVRLLREHAFPPAEYVLQKYNTNRRILLPWLYLRRIVSGAWKLR